MDASERGTGKTGRTSSADQTQTSGEPLVKTAGGLIALVAGLVVVAAIAIVGIAVSNDPGPIATGAVGVVGSIVGAYFGVKIGTDGTQKAVDAQREEATKAQVLARSADRDQLTLALRQAQAVKQNAEIPSQ